MTVKTLILLVSLIVVSVTVLAYPVEIQTTGSGTLHAEIATGSCSLHQNGNNYVISGFGACTTYEWVYQNCKVSHTGYTTTDDYTDYGPWPSFYNMKQLSNCQADICCLSISPNRVMVGTAVNVSSKIASPIDFGAIGPNYAPDILWDHYSVNTTVSLYADNQKISSKNQKIHYSGGIRAEFVYVPQTCGQHNVSIRTEVIDCQCSSRKPDTISGIVTAYVCERDSTFGVGHEFQCNSDGTKSRCNADGCSYTPFNICDSRCDSDQRCDGKEKGTGNCTDQCKFIEPFCGDGKLNFGERCELPGTINSIYCQQESSGCQGNKTTSRDSLGNCNSACQCDFDFFTNPTCVKGTCGAGCSKQTDCQEKCIGNIHYYNSQCTEGCQCKYETKDCDALDGWYFDHNYTTSYTDCQDKKVTVENYRDYGCSTAGCTFAVTQTRQSFAYINKAEGTQCNDNRFCTVGEQCNNGVCVGNNRDCSNNNLEPVFSCNNNPDGNPFTLDQSAGFLSICDEANDRCTTGTYYLTHSCNKELCDAECDNTDDNCPDTICSNINGCVGNDYYTYTDLENSCEECSCTKRECINPVITRNDPRCTECQIDYDCNSLDRDYCAGTVVKHDEGKCVNYECTVFSSATTNCTGLNMRNCSGTSIVSTTYTCSNAECVVSGGGAVQCDDTLFCNGQESCRNAQCLSGAAVDCEGNNLHIAECNHTPDNNSMTFDRYTFNSNCNEQTDSCALAPNNWKDGINHTCDKQACGAECTSNSECASTDCDNHDGCVGDEYYDYSDVSNSCNGCSCSSNQCSNPTIYNNDPRCTECQTDNDCVSLTKNVCSGNTAEEIVGKCVDYECIEETVESTDCSTMNHDYCSDNTVKADSYRCSGGGCILNSSVIKQNCNDGLFCDGLETCQNAQCISGTAVDCRNNNKHIAECNHNPDNNNMTFDSFSFDSTCNEQTDSCTLAPINWKDQIVHMCDKEACGAECTSNSECQLSNCNILDGCVGNDYYDYSDMLNTCDGCSCTLNQCGTPIIIRNDSRCTECQDDSDCSELNKTVCEEDILVHYAGKCVGYNCEAQESGTKDCTDINNIYCRGTYIKNDFYTCQDSACSLNQTTTILNCNDNLFCNGAERCSNAQCVPGSAVICSTNSINVSTCDYNPDNVVYTFDSYSFISACDEGNDRCTSAPTNWDYLISHSCDEDVCGAECDSDEDCGQSSCSSKFDDYCSGKQLVDYNNNKVFDFLIVADSCDNNCTGGCECTECAVSCTTNTPAARCVFGVCGATCDATHSCGSTECDNLDGCVGSDYYNYSDKANSCNGCACSANQCTSPSVTSNDPRCTECQTDYDCYSLDRDYCAGTVVKHDEGKCVNYACTVFSSATTNCTDLNSRNCSGASVVSTTYTCSNAECVVNGGGAVQCDDTLFCNGQESCQNAQCLSGAAVDCDGNNLHIAECNHTPDNNSMTFDRYTFNSNCNEQTDSCALAPNNWKDGINHTCDKQACGAECTSNSECASTDCDNRDGCVGDDYHDYSDVSNSCNGCSCSSNQCAQPTIYHSDTRCTECQTDSECISLTKDVCLGNVAQEIVGKCVNYQCTEQLVNSTDCFGLSNDYCSGSIIKRDNFRCSLGECILNNSLTKQNCNDGLHCNGIEGCLDAECVPGTAIECTSFDINISTCDYNPDSIHQTFDSYAFWSSCDEANDRCTTPHPNWQGSIEHRCETGCGAMCEADEECGPAECSAVYQDRCEDGKLVDYNNNKIDDSVEVSESCINQCLSDCSCSQCEVECAAPPTQEYCVKGLCGAQCSTDNDCNDSNVNTQDLCRDNCQCEHMPIPHCGDGILQVGESCELPNTSNNEDCVQSNTTCIGTKLAVRENFGECDSSCGCVESSFTAGHCIQGVCGAGCDCDADCNDLNPLTTDTCDLSSCQCDHSQIDTCVQDGDWGEGHEYKCENDGTYDRCVDGHYVHMDECSFSCGASIGCDELAPGTQFNSCFKTGEMFLRDMCNDQCQFVDGSCESRYTGCTGDIECDSQNPGTGDCTSECKINTINVSSIQCFDKVIENSEQSCSIKIESTNHKLGNASIRLFNYENEHIFGICQTDRLTGGCNIIYNAGAAGNYTVYATAERTGSRPDEDNRPMFNYEVLRHRYEIVNLKVFNDSEFMREDYDFFRGEPMYVRFQVSDLGADQRLVSQIVTKATLVSPPGGRAELTKLNSNSDWNYYTLNPIPPTHDFLGTSQVFTFAFNFSDHSGGEKYVNLTIRNNPPVIVGRIGPIITEEDVPVHIDLSTHAYDLEDGLNALSWSVLGGNNSLFRANIDRHILTVVPVNDKFGSGTFTLLLRDLDLDTDNSAIIIQIGRVNHGPKIISTPITLVEERSPSNFDAIYNYDVDAFDSDGDTITYSLVSAPSGMTINSATGQINWKPTKGQLGLHPVIVKASDGELFDQQSFTVEVKAPKGDIYPRRKIQIQTIRMDYQEYAYVHASDQVLVDLNYADIGNYDIKRSSIRITIEGLGISRKIGPVDGPEMDEVMHQGVLMDIPANAKPGVYTLRVTITTDDGLQRIRHRDIRVVYENT